MARTSGQQARDRSLPHRNDDLYLVLLRGINVGGNNKLPMDGLRSILECAGCDSVRTYIQSGNAVFRATPDIAESIATVAATGITKRYGLRVPVITRTLREWSRIITAYPYESEDANASRAYVGFLESTPPAPLVAALDPLRSPGDRFIVVGREIHMHLGNGAAKSKLTNAYFDAALRTTSTFRNMRTVRALHDLALSLEV